MSSQQNIPWQLRMFDRTLKKKLKLRLLQKHLGDVSAQDCLLVTCGDNNGALNHHFRKSGGRWKWADLEPHAIHDLQEFLGESVYAANPNCLPFADSSFDCVVSIDVHEHLPNVTLFNRELSRIVKSGGKVIVTVPNGDWWKPANVIKYMVGMSKEKYGHARIGYNLRDLKNLLSAVGFQPYATSSYSKFFTEMMELIVNFTYVMVLAKKSRVNVQEGTIAPSSHAQLKAVSRAYHLYSLVYPVFWLISRLDCLLFLATGYAVVVEAKRL